MKTLSSFLNFAKGEVVSLVGCGGKTSFIEWLALENIASKVLISPTTKIFPPREENAIIIANLADCKKHKPQQGKQYLGLFEQKTGKLSGLPAELLSSIVPEYDLILLEADGSKGLPCKGWLAAEPVIHPKTTSTIGIVPVTALGCVVNEENVLRLPEFLQLTHLQKNDIVEIKHIVDMLCAPHGMFQYSLGDKSIFINQVSSAQEELKAKQLLKAIQDAYPNRFSLLLYGNTFTHKWGSLKAGDSI